MCVTGKNKTEMIKVLKFTLMMKSVKVFSKKILQLVKMMLTKMMMMMMMRIQLKDVPSLMELQQICWTNA